MSDLQLLLEELSGYRLKLRWNQNRTTMLSKRIVERGHLRVSIHRAFAHAPVDVLEAVAAFLKGDEAKDHKRTLRTFIHAIDNKHPVDPSRLITAGKVYDLKEIYNKVNNEYFEGALDLNITWYTSKRRRRFVRTCTLGRYCDQRQLVSINTCLDSPRVIRQFVEFVVYHEMVHHIVPPTIDKAGRSRAHNKAFRQMERQFKDFHSVREWERRTYCGWT